MRALLLILLFPTIGLSQAKSIVIDGVENIIMTVPEASNVEAWGRKGMASVPLINSLDLKVELLGQKIEFKDFVIDNCKKAQEEYRLMVQRNAAEVNRLNTELSKLRDDRDKFKEKARKRGEKLWGIGGIAATGIAAFLFLK